MLEMLFYIFVLILTDDSGSSERDADNDEDDDKKNSDDDDLSDEENSSDASGPIPSYLENLPPQCFVTGKGEGLSERNLWSEDQEAKDSETEARISDYQVSTKKFQEESIYSLQSKRRDSKIDICNTTFVIDKSKGCSSTTYPKSPHIYEKPVSVVHPITSPGVKLSTKTSLSRGDQANSIESSGKVHVDLVEAVLCSRNKIALALAEIVKCKQPSGGSYDSTCHTDGESEETSSAEESCSTYASSLESSCRFRETCIGKKEKCGSVGREQAKLSVIRRPNNALASQERKGLDSETRQPLCSSADKEHRFVSHRSLKISPSSLDLETQSSLHSVKLKNCNFDMPRVNSSPVKRRSATLCKSGRPMKCSRQGAYLERCKAEPPIMCPGSIALGLTSGHQRSTTLCNLGGPVTCNGQGKYLERCPEVSLSMFPGSKALGTPSGHQTTPLVPRSISPALQTSSSNSKRRRSSQVLRVLDAATIESWSSVEKKAACFEHHEETRRTFLEKGDNLPKTSRLTTKLTASSSSPGEPARVIYSKRSLFLSNVTPDFVSSYQKSIGEDVCKEKRESSPSAVNNSRERKLSCSKTYSDLVNADSRGKCPPSSIALRKNSCDSGDYVRDIQDVGATLNETFETADEQTADELNCGRKLLASNLVRARADMEQFPAADQRGVQSKERVVKTSKKHAFSPGGSSRNSPVLSRGLESDNSPLIANVRKKRARESVDTDTPESLPSKHAKRGSPCSSYLAPCPPQSSSSSQALSCYRKESTPMKRTNLENLRLEGFLRQNTKPLSPIRRPLAHPRGSVNNSGVSPCKHLGSCGKAFCFDCC